MFGGENAPNSAAGCSPTAEDANERKASCSPPRGGGGELPTSQAMSKYIRQICRQAFIRPRRGRGKSWY